VHVQEAARRDRLGDLLADGIAPGEVSTEDPEAVVMSSWSSSTACPPTSIPAHPARGGDRPHGAALAEQELGLTAGALLRLGRLPDDGEVG
jgi:hypothetical protein